MPNEIRHPIIFAAGLITLGISGVMFFVAAALFTAKTVTPLWDWIGFVSFWGLIPVGILGTFIVLLSVFLPGGRE